MTTTDRAIAVLVDGVPVVSFTGTDLDEVTAEALAHARPLRAVAPVGITVRTILVDTRPHADERAAIDRNVATAPTAALEARRDELNTLDDLADTLTELDVIELELIEAELDRRQLDAETDDPRAREGLGLSARR